MLRKLERHKSTTRITSCASHRAARLSNAIQLSCDTQAVRREYFGVDPHGSAALARRESASGIQRGTLSIWILADGFLLMSQRLVKLDVRGKPLPCTLKQPPNAIGCFLTCHRSPLITRRNGGIAPIQDHAASPKRAASIRGGGRTGRRGAGRDRSGRDCPFGSLRPSRRRSRGSCPSCGRCRVPRCLSS